MGSYRDLFIVGPGAEGISTLFLPYALFYFSGPFSFPSLNVNICIHDLNFLS